MALTPSYPTNNTIAPTSTGSSVTIGNSFTEFITGRLYVMTFRVDAPMTATSVTTVNATITWIQVFSYSFNGTTQHEGWVGACTAGAFNAVTTIALSGSATRILGGLVSITGFASGELDTAGNGLGNTTPSYETIDTISGSTHSITVGPGGGGLPPDVPTGSAAFYSVAARHADIFGTLSSFTPTPSPPTWFGSNGAHMTFGGPGRIWQIGVSAQTTQTWGGTWAHSPIASSMIGFWIIPLQEEEEFPYWGLLGAMT